MSSVVFPRQGERWADCHICGFSFPYSKLTRHFKSKRLVDTDCADALSQVDVLERRRPTMPESGVQSEQPVANQGQADDLYSSQDVYGGAGVGGAGEGGPGGPGVGQPGTHQEDS
jgi:hypothetical protein